jgi:hypothetical protein
MWLITDQGFFSVVQKPNETELCVRARVREDLDRLRESHMPGLGGTVETRGGDYRYRAWIDREDLAAGIASIARSINYGNFKDRVARTDPERAHTYSQVWGILGELQSGGPYSG